MTKKPSQKSSKAPWNGAFDAFGKAFNQVKANPRPAILFAAAYLVVTAIELATLGTSTKDKLALASYEGLVYLAFLLALPTYGLAIADRKKLDLSEFMDFNFRKYFFVLGVSILYAIIVMVSLLLFVVPAIWAIAWFAFCVLVVADKGMNPVAALKESKRLAQNHKAKVWGIIGVTILFSVLSGIIASIPGIGQLVASVVSATITVISTGAVALLYRWSQTQASAK